MGLRNAVRNTYLWSMRNLLGVICRVLCGYRVLGRERLPKDGAVILAANHLSYLDPVMIGISMGRNLRYMAWVALFRNRVFAWFIRSMGAFPVDPDSWDVAAFRTALAVLKNGRWLVIFPEGVRSDDGQPKPLKAGVAHLAMRSGATIVPVRIEGTYEAWPRHNRLPRPFRRCQVRFGDPIPPPKLNGRDPATRHAAVDALLAQLRDALEGPTDGRETNVK